MSEHSELKRTGAKPMKNSGRGQYQKGDGLLDGLMTVDVKEYSETFSLSRNVWSKICMDAMRNSQSIPSLKIVLGSGNEKTRLMVISEDVFAEMWDAWKEKYVE